MLREPMGVVRVWTDVILIGAVLMDDGEGAVGVGGEGVG